MPNLDKRSLSLSGLSDSGHSGRRTVEDRQVRAAFAAGAPGAFNVLLPLLGVTFVAMLVSRAT